MREGDGYRSGWAIEAVRIGPIDAGGHHRAPLWGQCPFVRVRWDVTKSL